MVAAVYSTLGLAGSLAARLREDNLMAAAVFVLMILTVATSVPGSDQPKGSIICTPEPSKSLTLRVTRAAPRERVMAAIWQSRSPIHAATEGVGSGRISSDATFVSMTNMRSSEEIRRLAHGAAGGKFEVDAANGRETLAGERREIPGTGVATGDDITQDDAHFLLHRTVILGGAHAEARHYVFIEPADRDARHSPCPFHWGGQRR